MATTWVSDELRVQLFTSATFSVHVTVRVVSSKKRGMLYNTVKATVGRI